MSEEIENEDSGPLNADGTMTFQLGGNDRLTDWPNEPSIQVLKQDFEAAKPAHDTLVSNVKRWNNLLRVQGDAQPKKIKGRSSVQPKLIRRQAEWRYSALSEPFLSSQKLFQVSPATFEDGPGARQNQLVLNHQFRNKINRVKFVDDLVRATVDEGTSIVRLGWCRYTKTFPVQVPVYQHFPVESPEQLQQLQHAMELKTADPRTYNEQVPPEVQAAVDYLGESGIPTVAIQYGTETHQQEVIYENKPTVEVMNPANVYVDPSCEGDIDKALFVIASFETNQAELNKEPERYKNLDQVNWESNTTITDSDHETSTPDTFQLQDATRKKVVAYEYWGFYDIEGNGTLEPIVATWIGNVMIRMERNPFPDGKVPFVVIPYSPIKRELFGEPDAEMLEDNQKILGAVLRGMIDLLARSANGQRGYAKGLLDPVNRRKYEAGDDYEFMPTVPIAQGMIEHKFPELPQSALQMIGLQNQDAESLTGVKSFSGGLSGDAYGSVATGIKGLLDAAAKREMAILRRLAKGMSDIGKKILAMNSEFLRDEEVIRITNELPVGSQVSEGFQEVTHVTVRREELQGEFDCIVDISTAEVDNTKAQDLGFMLQTLGPNMDPRISMMILAEIAELKRMPVLSHQLRNWKPQPDPVQQQLQQLEIQKAQMEVAKLQSEIQLNQATAQQQLAAAGQKNLERIEQETGTKHARDLDRQQAQSRGNQHLLITKSLLEKRKPEETQPDVNAAIGYTSLSDDLERDNMLSTNR